MVLLRKDLTGAVTVLTSEDFNKGPVTSADQMITGKVAGYKLLMEEVLLEKVLLLELEAVLHCLLIMTLYMSLIVAAGGINGGRNPLTTINQNNIESITVLKMLLRLLFTDHVLLTG
jgi:iron complex outermembrane receptor protein